MHEFVYAFVYERVYDPLYECLHKRVNVSHCLSSALPALRYESAL